LDPLLKSIFDRPPIGDLGGDYSFPSGNAMASVVIVGGMALSAAAPWRRRTLALGVPIIVGYGVVLVYQLWHYPSDVVAGWCIAVAWMTALWLALGRARAHSGRPRRAETSSVQLAYRSCQREKTSSDHKRRLWSRAPDA
jgi:membrane-associated phospholipid phosphatase